MLHFMKIYHNHFLFMFRDYENGESERQQGVEEFYRMQHIHQTYDFVSSIKLKFYEAN